MATIALEQILPYSADSVWAIIGDVTRCDWVPSVSSIELNGDIRSFAMAGIGEVHEQIISCDSAAMCLKYSAIKTPANVEHHLATIQLSAQENCCNFLWTVEIRPDAFAGSIEAAMQASLTALKQVLTTTVS